jgi:hypothetical protein
MSGGATSDTALSSQTVTTASSGGTAITTAAEWSSPTYDEGVTWGYTGANAGRLRKVTSVSSTAGTVTIPFDYATASATSSCGRRTGPCRPSRSS